MPERAHPEHNWNCGGIVSVIAMIASMPLMSTAGAAMAFSSVSVAMTGLRSRHAYFPETVPPVASIGG